MADPTVFDADLASAAEAVVRTDGDGGIELVQGTLRTDPADACVALDVVADALATVGEALSLGGFRDALVTFDDGVLVLGRSGSRSVVGELAGSEVTAALLLNHLRRVLAGRASEGEHQ